MASTDDFTPGTWQVRSEYVPDCFSVVSDADGEIEFIATCTDESGYVSLDAVANARLIAAAPDGYNAAGAFVMAAINEWDIPEGRENDEGWLCDTLGHALADAFLKAMAFRAKARGEQVQA